MYGDEKPTLLYDDDQMQYSTVVYRACFSVRNF